MKSSRKVLILALSGGGDSHDSNLVAQKETWACHPQVQFPILWLQGGAKKTEIQGRKLVLDVEESYENLLTKSLKAFEWCLENLEFDAILRTNTSNYFDLPLLTDTLRLLPNDWCYAGPVQAHKQPGIFMDDGNRTLLMASGSAMLLTRSIVADLVENQLKPYAHLPDDVAIAAWMNERGIYPIPLPRSNVTDFEPLRAVMQIRVKNWQNPRITQDRMRQVSEIFNSRDDSELMSRLKDFDRREIRRLLSRIHREPRMIKVKMRAFESSFELRLATFRERLKLIDSQRN